MKRLFFRFEKETQIASSLLKKNKPKKIYVTSRHNPKYTLKEVEISVTAQITSSFNEWLNHLWNTNQSSTRGSTLGRPNKFMVGKWEIAVLQATK